MVNITKLLIFCFVFLLSINSLQARSTPKELAAVTNNCEKSDFTIVKVGKNEYVFNHKIKAPTPGYSYRFKKSYNKKDNSLVITILIKEPDPNYAYITVVDNITIYNKFDLGDKKLDKVYLKFKKDSYFNWLDSNWSSYNTTCKIK